MTQHPDSTLSSNIKRNFFSGERLVRALVITGLLLFLFLSFLPFFLMIIISFKDYEQYMFHPVTLTFPFAFENYVAAARLVAPSFFWTFIVLVFGIGMNVITASLASYAFSRYRFLGSEVLYNMIYILMFVPSILLLVPLYLWNVRLGLDNIWGLMLTYWILGHPFSVFLLTNFFRNIPDYYLQAARSDGAGHLTIWYNIIIPLGRPVIATLVVMMILWIYSNDFVWQQLLVGTKPEKVVSVALRGLEQSFSGGSRQSKGIQMAGYTIASLPTIIAFLGASNFFIRGLSSGAIKG